MSTVKKQVEKNFSRAANSYDRVAKVQKKAIDLVLKLLDQKDLRIKNVLDLGSGTGLARQPLMERFGGASYHALDISFAMLRHAQQHAPQLTRSICADMDQLPIARDSVNLVFSTSTIQWCNDLKSLMLDIRRAMTSDGLFVFSTFGPNTLAELRFAFAQVDAEQHVRSFASQQVLESALKLAGFEHIMLQSTDHVIEYAHPMQLLKDIKAAGASYHPKQTQGFYSKTKFARMLASYPASEVRRDSFPATYEVIYGFAQPNKSHSATV